VSPSSFVLEIADALIWLATKGYDILAVAAHAALETGWGESTLFKDQKNLFGIKGDGAEYNTVEYVDGIPIVKTEKFRKYDGYVECAMDYDRIIREHYPIAYKFRNSAHVYFLGLAKGGWATDPMYFQKLLWVYDYLLKGGS